MKQPIMEFENIEQAQECLKEWQERLFLSNWIISLEIKEVDNADGQNFIFQELGASYIRISPLTEERTTESNIKYCAEKILVHELLHCLLDYPKYSNPDIIQELFERTQHRNIDWLSRSLIMAKYDLPFEWFKNF